MSGEKTTPDILGMSDEDFLNMPGPGAVETPPTDPVDPPQDPAETPTDPVDPPADPSLGSNGENPTPPNEPVNLEVEVNGNKVESKSDKVAPESNLIQDDKSKTPDPVNPNPALADDGKTPKTGDAPAATAVNFEAEYKKIMAPFKANGKMIEPRTVEEAIQLMQMGANYTRKMQDIQPHRKVLMMLENNGLLDEGKLSYLIDIDKKNPQAIQKLLKDSGINPLDIDTESEPKYQATSHAVADAEVNFRTVLDDLSSHEGGKQTLQVIHSGWDNASKQALMDSPDLMTIIHEQRESGVYDRIAGEIERRRVLGTVSAAVPFLQAYKAVGDEMQAQGKFQDLFKPQVQTQVAPVATRVVAPKSQVANGDQANAAATTRTTARRAEKVVNPLSMSDDDFLKHMENRV